MKGFKTNTFKDLQRVFHKIKFILFTAFLLQLHLSFANVSLPSVLASGMVLQQNSEVEIWGWADPLEEINIITSWDNKLTTTVTDSHAKWRVLVKTPKAGGPFEIRIKGYNEILLENVLIGEVWICSGQSNMAWTASSGITNAASAIKNANYPNIRFFNVTKKTADTPQNDLTGNWQMCAPETMQYFSAVGYFFGKKIHENLNVPIGLINASWGGTPAEAWMPQETFVENEALDHSAAILQPQKWGPQKPSKLFNTMISPLTAMRIAGVIWYQGESNTVNASYYDEVFRSLILSWRELWESDFPFYYVQIAPFNYGTPNEGVLVRDAQRRVLEVPNTAMVVTSDIGNIHDIHPKNKADVGLRLANIALNKHYQVLDKIVEGPIFEKADFKNNRVFISFKNSDGLYFKTDAKQLFELAGEDGIFYESTAAIKDDKVLVTSKKVPFPKYVRYAWCNTCVSNLFNKANLPASSFTTYDKNETAASN